MRLDQHLAVHGALPDAGRRGSETSRSLIDEIARAGLRGRGGAAFPTATKLSAVAAAPGRAVVLANGCEGEPLSHKDSLLLERLPHLVLDGAIAAARAVGADEIVLATAEGALRGPLHLDLALRERADLGGRGLKVRLETVPEGYVSGQESAVVSRLNGGPAKPMAAPRVFERGLGRRPTLVSNVETLAHIALIARHGADWFRSLGTDARPGSTLVTVGGAVARPGVFEIAYGTPVASVMAAAGGVSEPLRAFLLGGYAGSWVGAEHGYRMELSGVDSGALGAGIFFALGESACPVAEVVHVAGWMAAQSAGQCGPCVNGLNSIAAALEQVRSGRDGEVALRRVIHWSSLLERRGACRHPDGVARFIASALGVFAADFDRHALHGACDACPAHRVLPAPMALDERMAA